MKLDSAISDFAIQPLRQNLDWSSKSYPEESLQGYHAGDWVKLLELPNPYSFDEALLLCQISQFEWITWIPDHGEARLNNKQFC